MASSPVASSALEGSARSAACDGAAAGGAAGAAGGGGRRREKRSASVETRAGTSARMERRQRRAPLSPSSAAAAQRQLEEVQSKLDHVTKQYDQLYHTTADQITHQALIIDDLAHHIWAIRELQKARGYFTFGRR